MNPKERLFTAFDLGKPDHVPATIFGGGMWVLRKAGKTFQELIARPKEMAEAYLRANELVHWPIIYCGSGYNNLHVGALGGKIKYRRVGAPDLEEPLVRKSADELDALNVDDLAKDPVIQTIWEATEIVAGAVGDEVVVTATTWGPFTLGAQIYGVERLMRSAYKAPAEVDKVVNFAARMILRFYEPLLDRGLIEMVSLADPTASGDLVSRKHFERFALPPLQMVTAAIRARGARILLHICGNTTDKLDLLTETGADCVSIDHKVDIARAKEVFRERNKCLAGNVDPVHVLNEGTPEKVRAASEKCLMAAAEGGGFVLMPGCDIPPTVPTENILAFMETAAAYKYG